MGQALLCDNKDHPDDSQEVNKLNESRFSIFERMQQPDQGNNNKFQNEEKIGVYFGANKDNISQVKVHNWKNLANKARKEQNKNQYEQESEVKLDKIDQMLFEIQNHRKDSFIKNFLDGPPIPLRWPAWKTLLKISKIQQAGFYEKMIENIQRNVGAYEQIKKDLIRTFPSQNYFSSRSGISVGHDQLLRVLSAISNFFVHLGYCQGMNFVLGFLILVSGGNEIDVFWCFMQLAQRSKYMIIGIFDEQMPLLMFLEFVTEKIVQDKMGAFWKKFQDLEVPNSFWMTKWFMTLFLYNFPVNICLRIWDYFMVEGIFGLCYIIVPILKIFEKDFLEMEQLDVLEFFQTLTRNEAIMEEQNSSYFMDMTKVITEAKKLKLPRKKIEKYAKDFIQIKGKNEFAEIYQVYSDKVAFKNQAAQLIYQKINEQYRNDIYRSSVSSRVNDIKSTLNSKNITKNDE